MPQTSDTTSRISSWMAGADPVDIATVRALWCALHPDAPVRKIVDELVAEAGGRAEVLQEAIRRLQSGRLERSTWVVEPALAVLQTALAETSAAPRRGSRSCTRPAVTNDSGAFGATGRTI